MGETLDIVLSDERITLIEAIFLLKDHFKKLSQSQRQEVLLDLKHVFKYESPF